MPLDFYYSLSSITLMICSMIRCVRFNIVSIGSYKLMCLRITLVLTWVTLSSVIQQWVRHVTCTPGLLQAYVDALLCGTLITLLNMYYICLYMYLWVIPANVKKRCLTELCRWSSPGIQPHIGHVWQHEVDSVRMWESCLYQKALSHVERFTPSNGWQSHTDVSPRQINTLWESLVCIKKLCVTGSD